MKNDQTTANNHEMDNRLAEFTDQMMAGKPTVQPSFSADAGLQDLENTLHRLKNMVDSDQPRPELYSLLEVRLKHAWEEQQARARQEKKNPAARLPSWLRQPSPVLSFTAAVVVLVIAIFALLPGDLPLQGAAGVFVSSILPWIASASLIIMLMLLINTYRKK